MSTLRGNIGKLFFLASLALMLHQAVTLGGESIISNRNQKEQKVGNSLYESLTNKGLRKSTAENITAEWIRHYSEGADDKAYAITIDNKGNIYVTGTSYSSETSYDYLTIKYNSEGVQKWAVRYNAKENLEDYARAIAVDNNGNVFVTGESYNPDYTSDWVTVKYDSSGGILTSVKYNYGDLQDAPTALVVDSNGNVYVTGSCQNLNSGFDIVTIKYNQYLVKQWEKAYNNSQNLGDYASDIKVDNLGNVYVAGYSYRQFEEAGSIFDYSNYITLKYNSSGDLQWAVEASYIPYFSFNYAKAMTLDCFGNVYVTGNAEAFHQNRFFTVRYDSSGNEKNIAEWA